MALPMVRCVTLGKTTFPKATFFTYNIRGLALTQAPGILELIQTPLHCTGK